MTKGYSFDALVKKVDGVKEAVRIPTPDFYLPLKHDLMIREGKGSPVQIDVSSAQDGSVMAPVPGLYQADFTRASKATYIDDQGVLREAQINEPRFEKEGVLIEGSSTNYLTFSNDINNWIISGATSTAVIGPDNVNGSAWELTTTSGAGDKGVRMSANVSAANKTYTASVFVKGSISSRTFWRLGTTDSTHASNQTSIDIGGDYPEWTRVSVTRSFPADTTGSSIMCRMIQLGSDTGTYSISSAQVEELPFASSYISTTGTIVTRTADSLTSRYSGHKYTVFLKVKGGYDKFRGQILGIRSLTSYGLELQGHSGKFIELKYDGTTLDGSAIVIPDELLQTEIDLCLTYDGSEYCTYINGAIHKVIAQEKSGNSVSGDLGIFTHATQKQSDPFVNGCEVHIWNQALTAEQIKYL